MSDYPHKCFACGSAAYCGLTTVDCSNGGCVHGKRTREAPAAVAPAAPVPPPPGPRFRSLFQPGEYRLQILRVDHGLTRAGRAMVEVNFRIHESSSPHLPVGGEVTWIASNPRAFVPLIRAVGTDVLADMVGTFLRARAESVKTKRGYDYMLVTFKKDVP